MEIPLHPGGGKAGEMRKFEKKTKKKGAKRESSFPRSNPAFL